MSIQTKNGKYYAVVYTGYKDGKRSYEWSESFTNKKLAKLKEHQMEQDHIMSGSSPIVKGNFKDLSTSWFAVRKKKVSASTHAMNLEYYNLYIRDYFESYNVKEVTPLIANNFAISLDYAPATYNKIVTILRQIMEFAVDMHMAYDNPCKKIQSMTVERKKHITWTEEQIGEFLSLDMVKKDNSYIAFMIMFATGMRPGEVCGLRWCDYDIDHFNPDIGISRNRAVTDLKNNKAHESVYIPQYLINALAIHKKKQKILFFSNGIKFRDENYINCLEPDMRPMRPDSLSQSFRRLVRKTELPQVYLYEAVRHSFGTNMMRKGINPKEVAEAMRHTSVKTTLDNYSHVDDKMKKNLMDNYAIKIN